MRRLLLAAFASFCLLTAGPAALPQSPSNPADTAALDSDRDGLSDALEQALLAQFVPALQVAIGDCSSRPALFAANLPDPTVQAEDGTLYGQVTPRPATASAPPSIEIHYYHLWRKDCGRFGHDLDAEHVSVLLRPAPEPGQWRAAYWFAAAHQDTVCDASQIARASTLQAEDYGASVSISAGKHASFLNPALCPRGCGGDSCLHNAPLSPAGVVNLGEPGAPMNGAAWAASPRWPLAAKMAQTDFPPAVLARLESLPATDIAWVIPGKHPARATIAVSNSTADAIALGNRSADTALSLASASAGSALGKTYKNVKHALGVSTRAVGKALPSAPSKTDQPQ